MGYNILFWIKSVILGSDLDEDVLVLGQVKGSGLCSRSDVRVFDWFWVLYYVLGTNLNEDGEDEGFGSQGNVGSIGGAGQM